MNISVIAGQSATGKTNRALEQARNEQADIINFDSRQIYKRLDIVTGKDFSEPEFHKIDAVGGFDIGYYVVDGIKVWLYDIADPKSYFSSFDYAACALHVLNRLKKERKNAILVGGTYLYLHHLLYRVDTEKIPPDTKLRNSLNPCTVAQLQERLKQADPVLFDSLNNSEINNPQRLIRKIEIASYYAGHGKPVSAGMRYEYRHDLPGTITNITSLAFGDRDRLRTTIAARVEKRLKQGAVTEVKNLLSAGYSLNDPGMRTIGCQELGQSILGECTLSEAVEAWTLHEIQYTKRQLTFMKKDPHFTWIEV